MSPDFLPPSLPPPLPPLPEPPVPRVGSIESATPEPCPHCGTKLSTTAAQGLCPTCLMRQVAEKTDAGSTAAPIDPAAALPSNTEIGEAFPELEIIKLIGSGGMGIVFQARQRRLDRPVALKLLPKGLATDPTFAERFLREGRLLARMNHPNIVSVHDFGDRSGFFYMVMEYVDGVNLRQAMRAGRFTTAQALGVVPKICDALQYAHEEGILHRDIKPENILIDERGRIKIADFGIAKLRQKSPESFTLTQSGASLGTPAYMAPEQIERPADVDHRADIYSLGVVLYEMLTGELPLGRFSPPSEITDMDTRIDAVVMRTLEKERARRYQSADEMKTHVESVRQTTASPLAGAGGPSASASDATADQPETYPISWGECWHCPRLFAICGMVILGWLVWLFLLMDGIGRNAESLLIIGSTLIGLAVLAMVVLKRLQPELPWLPLRPWSSVSVRARVGLAAGGFGLFLGCAGLLGSRNAPLGEAAVFGLAMGLIGLVAFYFLRPPHLSAAKDVIHRTENRVFARSDAAPSLPWSMMAIISPILTVISLLPLVVPFVLMGVNLASRKTPNTVSAQFAMAQLIFVAVLSLVPGLVGTILGWVSLGQIRRAGGKLRGRRLALLGAWGWIITLVGCTLTLGLMRLIYSILHIS